MILTLIENLIIDDMTKRQIRYIKPVKAKEAQGKLAKTYKQIRADFQLVPPLTMFSPCPELLAGVWSIWRESQFAVGQVPRFITEAIAAGVSSINTCPYCVDAHTGMLHASSDNDIVKAINQKNCLLIKKDQSRHIVEWALANRSPNSDILESPPFSEKEAPEIIGTAVVYHFINRMVSIFLDDTPLPVPSRSGRLRGLASFIFGKTIGIRIIMRKPEAGKSLKFIPSATLANDMRWSLENKNIAASFSGFTSLLQDAADKIIPEHIQNLTQQHINAWNGNNMDMGRDWLNEIVEHLSHNDKPVARLTLLSALAPYQVCENDILEFRSIHPTDAQLLTVTSWASFSAARKVSHWLYKP